VPGSDPAAVARTAREKFENSQKKSAAGDHQGAYRDAAEAWEMVHSFESDAACSALASRIFSQLDSLADQANREAGGAERIRGSTLIEK
jgi:hypothetical protein